MSMTMFNEALVVIVICIEHNLPITYLPVYYSVLLISSGVIRGGDEGRMGRRRRHMLINFRE